MNKEELQSDIATKAWRAIELGDRNSARMHIKYYSEQCVAEATAELKRQLDFMTAEKSRQWIRAENAERREFELKSAGYRLARVVRKLSPDGFRGWEDSNGNHIGPDMDKALADWEALK